MSITQTFKQYRPNTETTWFTDIGFDQPNPNQAVSDMFDQGNISLKTTITDNGLTSTSVMSYDTLDAFNIFQSTASIDTHFVMLDYYENLGYNRFDMIEKKDLTFTFPSEYYPLRVIVTYTFQPSDDYKTQFAHDLLAEVHDASVPYRKSMKIVGDDFIVVYEFTNNNNFTFLSVAELKYMEKLIEHNVTRQIKVERV